jgi:hypothetical protein
MYKIFGSDEQVPEQPMGAFQFDSVKFLCGLWVEERVERFAPVSPPGAVLDETKVPLHVDAAHRDFRISHRIAYGPLRELNVSQCRQTRHGRSMLVISTDTRHAE